MKKALPLRGKAFSFVGVAGFEPATLWSQTRCANRAALHPALTSEALAKADFPSLTLYKEVLNPFSKKTVYKGVAKVS